MSWHPHDPPRSVSTRLAPELACPRCRQTLDVAEQALVCARHGGVGRFGAGGIFEFDRSDTYWGEVERDRMRRINAAAREHGWSEALARHLAPERPELLRYVQHPTRADWRVLLPLDRERTVSVDVGAGWGASSFALSPHVLRHYAVEKIAERVEFISIRAHEDAVDNVVPVRADLHALPFAPASIDVFAVNGVLEWAGLADPQAGDRCPPRSPRVLQESFLRQLLELLRPGGWLYVGIENRFGRMFWRGTPDHQGLRFTSLMPRQVARAYTRLRAARSPRTFEHERDYRAWTYSLPGYRGLFARCGFVELQCYGVVPGYNVPTQIVPLEAPGAFAYLAKRSRSSRRILGGIRRCARLAAARLGLERYVTSCYAFVVRRPGETTT
ncbi:MAG: class I SAM-dependent methyltransferase [Candidatus Krumholzibacteriia bacterium]